MSMSARRRRSLTLLFASGVFAMSLAMNACRTRGGPKDIDNLNPRSEFADGVGGHSSKRDAGAGDGGDRVIANPSLRGRKPREIAEASARAIVTTATHVYFGDTEDDAVYRLAKTGGDPTRIARRAPMPGALSIDASASGDDPSLLWVGSPGDAVLRVLLKGLPAATTVPAARAIPDAGVDADAGANANVNPNASLPPMTTLREGAIFANVAASHGDVYVTEVRGPKGALTRFANGGSTAVAMFDGSPKGLAVDATHIFIATTTHLSFITRSHGSAAEQPSELATGTAFASPQVDDTFVYATMLDPKGTTRSLVRIKKPGTGGGPASIETIASNVRDAPIALRDGEVFWFDAERPALLAMATSPAAAAAGIRTVSEDPILDHVYGLAIDDDGAFIASGYGEGGRILNVLLR